MRPMPVEVSLDGLYQEVILDHNRRPRNFHKLEGANAYSHGVNPLCGDDYHLYLSIADGMIQKVGFEGHGCAISKSSASIMTTMIEGKSVREAGELEKNFIRLITDREASDDIRSRVGRLKIFEGVKKFPVRVKCATLIWRALEEALKTKDEHGTEFTTEDGP